MIVTRRRWRTGRGNYMGAWLVAQLWPLPWAGPVLPCRLDAFFNAALPGMADHFYRERVDQHLRVGIRALELLRIQGVDQLHSRKLRSFAEVAFQ